MDTDKLFEKYTIDEIRDIEKKTRQNIERKKEDLRQMVGERYRDVIEAADTITDMKSIAQNLSSSLTKMQDLCQNLEKSLPQKHSIYHKPAPKFKKPQMNPLYGVSAEMKLLLEMPEKIWSSLDSHRYLRSTQLFLLARHVHTALQLSPGGASLMRRCPLLGLQWAAISQIRTSILDGCRERLRNADMNGEHDQVMADCLVSIMLLEDSTPRQVFNQFLLARTSAIQSAFQNETSQSVKSTVCDVVQLMVTTLHQVYTLFSKPTGGDEDIPCNLLMLTLDAVTDKGESGMILREHASLSMKCLPTTVLDFRPGKKPTMTPVSAADITQRVQQWIDTCSSVVSSSLSVSLDYISSVKGLAAIRDDVWTRLSSDASSAHWDVTCEALLQRPLSVWDQFLQPVFLARTKAILQSQLDTAFSSSQQQIGRVLADLGNPGNSDLTPGERNVASYVWMESATDIVPNMAWVPTAQKALTDSGTLMMKAKAYTPAVQSLCRNFDGKLRGLLEDCSHYTKVREEQGDIGGGHVGAEKDKTTNAAFDQYGDKTEVEGYMHTACSQAVHKLLSHLEQQLYASKQQLANSTDPLGHRIILDRVLLLGRLTSALCDLCTHLQICTVGENKPKPAKSIKKSLLGRSSKVPENPEWTKLKGKLQTFSQDAYRVWSEHTCGVLLSQFEAALLNTTGHGLLLSSNKWDEIEIEEETEEGKKVRSTIRVPMQPSWYLQSTIYSLCQEVNRVGGHALRRCSVESLISSMLSGMLDAYDKCLHAKSSADDPGLALSQNRALQLMFDVKFVQNVLPAGEENEKSIQKRIDALCDGFEARVDPFDLDVFSPYMKSHVARQTQRSQVLYGALTCMDRSAISLSSRPLPTSSSSHQEQHNVLPLTTSSGRFPLLPLSVHNSGGGGSGRLSQQPILAPPKPKTSPLHVPMVTSPTHKSPDQTDSSFFGQMSTIWFSNVKK